MNEKIYYVVTAYRYGDREAHSYVLGVFDKKHAAKQCADSHTEYRGGKYSCEVEELSLNHFDNKDREHSKSIYKTKHTLQ